MSSQQPDPCGPIAANASYNGNLLQDSFVRGPDFFRGPGGVIRNFPAGSGRFDCPECAKNTDPNLPFVYVRCPHGQEQLQNSLTNYANLSFSQNASRTGGCSPQAGLNTSNRSGRAGGSGGAQSGQGQLLRSFTVPQQGSEGCSPFGIGGNNSRDGSGRSNASNNSPGGGGGGGGNQTYQTGTPPSLKGQMQRWGGQNALNQSFTTNNAGVPDNVSSDNSSGVGPQGQIQRWGGQPVLNQTFTSSQVGRAANPNATFVQSPGNSGAAVPNRSLGGGGGGGGAPGGGSPGGGGGGGFLPNVSLNAGPPLPIPQDGCPTIRVFHEVPPPAQRLSLQARGRPGSPAAAANGTFAVNRPNDGTFIMDRPGPVIRSTQQGTPNLNYYRNAPRSPVMSPIADYQSPFRARPQSPQSSFSPIIINPPPQRANGTYTAQPGPCVPGPSSGQPQIRQLNEPYDNVEDGGSLGAALGEYDIPEMSMNSNGAYNIPDAPFPPRARRWRRQI